jgi:Rrf2 family transcriptional regulator, iron-sulfur cluster assembly transcription factor
MISQTAGYAILALSCIERHNGRRVMGRRMAAETGAPGSYLSKILRELGKAGLVEGQRGHDGGYRLCRSADCITLLQVVRAVHPDWEPPACMLGLMPCSDDWVCPTHAFWSRTRKQIIAELDRVTLTDVAGFYREARVGGRAMHKRRAGRRTRPAD